MLFNCNGLILVTYLFNGGWLAVTIYHCHHNHVSIFFFQTSGQEIHVDLVGQEYRNVIDEEEVTIMNLEAKFMPKG